MPPEAVPIGNSCFAVLISDDTFTYFSNLVPFASHPADDRAAMLMRIGRLAVISALSPQDLADAFCVSRSTVQRARRRYLAEGEAAFLKPRRGRGPSVFTPALAKRATALLEAGLSGAAVARVLGVSKASVHKWRRRGLIGKAVCAQEPAGSAVGAPCEARVAEEAGGAAGPEAGEAQPLADTAQSGEPGPLDAGTQTDRSARDRPAPMGRATCDVSGRVLASSGQAGPVEPQFASAARGVRSGGVLTALPALLKEGLLAASDALPTHELEPLDPDTMVVNPLRRAYDKAIRSAECRLASLRNRSAGAARKKRPKAQLRREVSDLEGALEIARASRRNVPKHCRAGDLDEDQQLDALPSRDRILLDIIRMIAYRAETRMMLPVMQGQGKKPHPRKLLQALMTADADILPDPANGVLRVHILGLANDACDRQIDALLNELNATETLFPGTDLRMVYEIDAAPEPTQPVSHQITRGQEV